MKHFDLSPSTLGLFKNCPRCFWFYAGKGIRERIAKMEEQQQKLLDDRLEGLIDKDLCYRKLSQIQRDLDLANVRLKEIQDDNNANYMALNKTIDVLGDLYKLYKNSDTPTRHMYHKAFFEAIVVDEKKIIGLKWKVPFSTLYQPNSQSVLQPFGEPGDRRMEQFVGESEKYLLPPINKSSSVYSSIDSVIVFYYFFFPVKKIKKSIR